MFWGCHDHVVDEKGRTSLPKEFRDLLTRGPVPWLTARSRCLAIYPADKFDKIRQRLSDDVLNDAAESLERLIIGHATPCSVDKAGRILIPAALRRLARIEKQITFMGLTDRVEIWDRSRYEAEIISNQEHEAENSRYLRSLTR